MVGEAEEEEEEEVDDDDDDDEDDDFEKFARGRSLIDFSSSMIFSRSFFMRLSRPLILWT